MKLHYFTNFFFSPDRRKDSFNLFLLDPLHASSTLMLTISTLLHYRFVIRKNSLGEVLLHFLNNFSKPVLFKKYCKKYMAFIGCLYNKLYFAKYFYVGLGYKLFVFLGKLFVWVGLTHYSLVSLPATIKIFPKKRRIYILGSSLVEFSNLLATIRRIRKMDIYKGKGLLEVKSYKGFIRMKSGKKKQY